MPKTKMADEATIKAARDYYKKRLKHRNTKVRRKFGWWLRRFENDCRSLADIGREAGYKPSTAREAVRQLYQQYFAGVIPNRPFGQTRQKFCVLKTNQSEAKAFSNAPARLQTIARLAAAQGLEVERVPAAFRKRSSRVATWKTTSLSINKQPCQIHWLTARAVPWSSLKYSHLGFTASRVQQSKFSIVVQELTKLERNIFIIPAQVLLRWLGPSREKWVNIRAQPNPVYPNRDCLQQIDFWQYLNAWHLLQA